MNRHRLLLGVIGVAAATGLAGCGAPDHDNLRSELSTLTVGVKGQVEPLPPVIAYTPFPYHVEEFPDPFSPQKILASLRGKGGANGPNLLRPREPLEAFPIESMQVVGSLTREGQVYALVKTERGLYRVTRGNHIGQNFGQVVRVTEGEMEVKELFQDGAGDWSEKLTVVPLQEASAAKK